MLLPLVYLVVRTFDAGGDIWDLLFRQRILSILGRTVLLVVTVTGASVILALPLAWLTSRTDLPMRRAWVVLSALPLVIPSYVAGFIVVVDSPQTKDAITEFTDKQREQFGLGGG